MKTLTAVLALAVATSTAHAETAPPSMMELMTEGAARSNAGEHGAAAALYEQAYAQDHDAALLPIIATEYRRAGLPLDAVDRFCKYLATQPKGAQSLYATTQLIAIHKELGESVPKDRICTQGAPGITPIRIDFVTPKKKRSGMSKREMAGIAAAAVGVVSLGASLYYGFEARDISRDIANHPPHQPWPANIQELEDRGERYESKSNIYMIAGGAALVTAGVLYFTGRASRLSESNTVIAPTVTQSGGGISFSRGF